MDKYLDKEIVACCGNSRTMWLVVSDTYNYMLFDCTNEDTIRRYNSGWMPRNIIPYLLPNNRIRGGAKHVEFQRCVQFARTIPQIDDYVTGDAKYTGLG